MGKEDPHIARAERSRGLDEIVFPHLEHLPAHHARIPYPADNTQRQNHLFEPRPEKRDQRDGQQKARKGQEYVKNIPRQEFVYNTAVKPAIAPTTIQITPETATSAYLSEIRGRKRSENRSRPDVGAKRFGGAARSALKYLSVTSWVA